MTKFKALPMAPYIDVPGDTDARIMARSPVFRGMSYTRALWVFGFLQESDHAHMYCCSVKKFIWVLADHHGNVLETFEGMAYELPRRFRRILNKCPNGRS